jgi:hypothetical protein
LIASHTMKMVSLVSYGKTTEFNELHWWNWVLNLNLDYVKCLHRDHVYEPLCVAHLWTIIQN